MMLPLTITAGGKPVMPVVAPGERPTLPLRIVVPTTPVLVMAVPPRSVKLPEESRIDWADPANGEQSSAATTAAGRCVRCLIVMTANNILYIPPSLWGVHLIH